MTGGELIRVFAQAKRRTCVVGTEKNGVIVALDMEGRLFTVVDGRVLSKVNPEAILARSTKEQFQNPGGDALWPAPEGTRFGYEYATGSWRVPPSVTGAVWTVVSEGENECVVRAEIDLVNNLQVGIPCEFERHIRIERGVSGGSEGNILRQRVGEMLRYIGKRTLIGSEFSLSPWSLCQFASSERGVVTMPPPPGKDDIWDMYAPSDDRRGIKDGVYTVRVKTPERFQLAMSGNVPWIRYQNESGYTVTRYTEALPPGQRHIDIADAPPDRSSGDKGVSLSVYCDPSGFVELEACGGCTETLENGTELTVNVITEFELHRK